MHGKNRYHGEYKIELLKLRSYNSIATRRDTLGTHYKQKNTNRPMLPSISDQQSHIHLRNDNPYKKPIKLKSNTPLYHKIIETPTL